jgi:hypothetical protein
MSTTGTIHTDKLQEHLYQALETDDPDEKNYHIRTALQLAVIHDDQ